MGKNIGLDEYVILTQNIHDLCYEETKQYNFASAIWCVINPTPPYRGKWPFIAAGCGQKKEKEEEKKIVKPNN